MINRYTLWYQKATCSMISAFKAWFVLHKHDLRQGVKKGVKFKLLRDISFSLSPLKQKRWLNRFVLIPFAKLLRYEMSDLNGLKYKNNSTWNQDPVHSMHTTVTWKTTVSRPKNGAEDPPNCKKNRKKS